MTIKEVELLLEIPKATVRFYEKEGLVNIGIQSTKRKNKAIHL